MPVTTQGKTPTATIGTKSHNQKSDVGSASYIPLRARRVIAMWNMIVLKPIDKMAHGSLLSMISEMRIQIQNVDASSGGGLPPNCPLAMAFTGCLCFL